MKRVLKKMPKVLLIMLFVLMFAVAALVGTMVLSPATGSGAEASAASSISLSQLAGGSWTWSDHSTKVTIGQWKGSSFKRYTDNTLGVGYRYDSSSCVTTSGLEYTVPTGQTIESFSLSITTTAAVKITYQVYKSSASSPWGYDYPDSGISASGNTYSVTNSAIYHRNSYKATTLTGGDKITFAIYDDDVITHSGSSIYTGGKVARDGNIAVTALSITLNNAAYSVSIKAGTGIKEAFLSTSSVATSGSASGTKFDVDSYVYGFVKLNAGYRKPNSANWTLIDGTANQENAIYRVAEQKVGSKNVDFGTINAEAKTKNLYKMDGSISKGYETLNWGQAKTIPAITKTGYNFINYNTAADGTGTTYGNSSGVSLTATQVNAIIDSSISSFYAQWSAKTFEVTFDKEGGTGGDDGVTMTYDQPAPGSIVVPSKPGYTFQGYTATHPTNYSVITVYNSNGEATSSKWQIDSAVSPRATWYGKPYKAYITAGTGVKSVYLSSSYSATPGSSSAKQSGSSFTNGQYLCAYIVLERGYVAPGDWALSSGDYYIGDGVFRKSVLVDIASDEEEDLKYDFGTINATKGNFAVGISAGAGVSAVKLSAKDDGTDLVNANSKFVFDSQVYAYATLSVGYNAQDGWTLIDGESDTAGALYLVDTIENIDIDSDFGAISAIPKQYTVTLEGLDDPITATYDAPLSALEQFPTREGYTFVGYFDQVEGGNQYIDEDGTSTGRTWKINEEEPQLYAHWLKTLVYEVNDYNGDYDRAPHTISYIVTEPESGAVILFGTTEGNYVLAENELPTYTDVGVYTIYYQISADVNAVLYKTVEGSATVTITKVDTTALSALIDEVNDYYNDISDDYPTIASTLNGHKQQIINDYITENNVTDTEVAAAVVELQGYLDKAHADVVDELIDAIGVVDLGKEDEIGSARVAYNNLTDVQKALVADIDDLVDAEVELVELLIADIAPIEYTQACKDKIDKAREFYEDLTGEQKAEVDNYQDLVNAEKAYDAMEKIEAIGKPVVNDEVTREKADVARETVNALTPDQLALVDPDFIADLENAEAVLNFLDALNAIGAPVNTEAFKNKVEDARDLYNALDEADIEDLVMPADLKTLTDDEAVVAAMDLINACVPVEDTEEFRNKVDSARGAYNALSTDQKDLFPEDVLKVLSDDEVIVPVMDEIDAIGAPENTDAFRDKVESAREAYEDLSDDQKDIFPEDVLKTLEDDEAVVTVMDLVNACAPVEDTDEFRSKVESAREAYDALTDDQKSIFPADVLKVLTDDEAVVAAMDLINACAPVEDTDEFRGKVESAREAYNALTDDQKDIFPADVLKVLTDDEAIVPVMNEIDAIGTPEDTEDFRDKVENARGAYNALSDDQKDVFPEDVLKVLTDDEAIVSVMDEIDAIGAPEDTEDFRSAVENARESYDGLSDDQKDTFPADVLKTLEDDEAVVDAMDIINAIAPVENDPECAERVQEARDAYDGLSDDQEAIVPEAIVKSLTDAEAAIGAIDKTNAIGDLVFDESEEKINEARKTYDGLTPDQKALVPAETLKELEDKETAYQAMEKINAIGDVDLTDASKELIDEAREAYDALTPDQKAFVNADDLQELIDAEKAYEAMKKIDAIGTVEYTPESKALIDEAKAYFDALSDEQKAAVDNKDVLFKAEDDYAKVEAGIQKVSAIQNIRYDETSKSAIFAAREAYDALSVDQKAFFPEETLKELVDNEEAIKALEMISSIGGVEYSEESKDLIERARESYDSLTAEQKALIHVDDVATLTDSEQSYEELHDNAKIIYTTLLVIVCILLIIGLLILAYLVCRILKEKKKDGDNVMSVAFLPILLGASHYVDDPFIALYVLAALTVIVYIIDVILALRFPHFIKDVKKFFSKKKDADEEEEATLAPEDEDLPPVRVNEEVSEDDREEEDEDEIVFATDKSGNLFRIRFIRSFMAKLIQSSDETKAFYKELKNEILSYKGVKDRLSWHYDSHNKGRDQLVKFGIRGKTLCLYFALDMRDLKGSKYRVELCESAKYAAVPCMYRIKSAHRCEYAKDLIAMVAGKFGLVKGEQQTVEYSFPYESTEDLIAKGLIKELKTQWGNAVEIGQKSVHPVSVREADRAMSDEVAATFIQDDVDGKVHEGKKGIINIDVIGKAFNDGDTVDIEALWEKKLIPLNVGYVKVLARGALDKKLNVDLQDYSIQAVKMIALKGGTVKKAK